MNLLLNGQMAIREQLNNKCDITQVEEMINRMRAEERKRNEDKSQATEAKIDHLEHEISAMRTSIDTNAAAITGQSQIHYDSKLNKITEDFGRFTGKLQELEDYIKNQNTQSQPPNMDQQIATIMNEIQERERRKKSVVFCNVPECESDAIEERVDHDSNVVTTLCKDTMDLTNEIKEDCKSWCKEKRDKETTQN